MMLVISALTYGFVEQSEIESLVDVRYGVWVVHGLGIEGMRDRGTEAFPHEQFWEKVFFISDKYFMENFRIFFFISQMTHFLILIWPVVKHDIFTEYRT